MNLDLSAYPMVANTDYSPTNESFSWQDSFDLACLVDLYTTPPDYSLDTFFDCPVSSVEFPAGLNYRSAFHPAPPFGQLEQNFVPSFDTASTFDPRMPTTPTTTPSSAPSLCGDGTPALASPPLSPLSLKREIPNEPSPGEEPAKKRPQRKRGRPRLDRKLSDAASISYIDSPSSKHYQRTSPLPHNQVERKYRENLNSELERLRRAVPTLPQSGEGAFMGQSKPSKAMVLSGAIEYIRKIEQERDELRERNEQLGERKTKSWR
ncbi:hypothetical protein GQ44DRAFT_777710 [Phaeosphaeriaceae sp. PMI808]|nr:hypothetical protein GQ44DRAFT_777710 [Phaeosphaeriaceae sp. PMI808]